MNRNPIASSWNDDAPLQLSLPLRFEDTGRGILDPTTEQDHPEQFEPQPAELQ